MFLYYTTLWVKILYRFFFFYALHLEQWSMHLQGLHLVQEDHEDPWDPARETYSGKFIVRNNGYISMNEFSQHHVLRTSLVYN